MSGKRTKTAYRKSRGIRRLDSPVGISRQTRRMLADGDLVDTGYCLRHRNRRGHRVSDMAKSRRNVRRVRP